MVLVKELYLSKYLPEMYTRNLKLSCSTSVRQDSNVLLSVEGELLTVHLQLGHIEFMCLRPPIICFNTAILLIGFPKKLRYINKNYLYSFFHRNLFSRLLYNC